MRQNSSVQNGKKMVFFLSFKSATLIDKIAYSYTKKESTK